MCNQTWKLFVSPFPVSGPKNEPSPSPDMKIALVIGFWQANGVEIWPFPFRSVPFRSMNRIQYSEYSEYSEYLNILNILNILNMKNVVTILNIQNIQNLQNIQNIQNIQNMTCGMTVQGLKRALLLNPDK